MGTVWGNLNFMKPDKEEAIKGVMKCSKGRKWAAWLPSSAPARFLQSLHFTTRKFTEIYFSITLVDYNICSVTLDTFWVIFWSLGAHILSQQTSHSFALVFQFFCARYKSIQDPIWYEVSEVIVVLNQEGMMGERW